MDNLLGQHRDEHLALPSGQFEPLLVAVLADADDATNVRLQMRMVPQAPILDGVVGEAIPHHPLDQTDHYWTIAL